MASCFDRLREVVLSPSLLGLTGGVMKGLCDLAIEPDCFLDRSVVPLVCADCVLDENWFWRCW